MRRPSIEKRNCVVCGDTFSVNLNNSIQRRKITCSEGCKQINAKEAHKIWLDAHPKEKKERKKPAPYKHPAFRKRKK